MTPQHLYMFNPKDMSLVSKHSLQQITQLLMIAANESLLGVKMKQSHDLFLETIRRTEFVVYLLTSAEL